MTDATPPHYAGLTDVAAGLRDGRITATELTRHLLARIEVLDRDLHAFRDVTPERALHQAEQADADLAGEYDRGPLHGIPIAVKDVLAASGTRPAAAAVERLRTAGAVVLGTLQTAEGPWLEQRRAGSEPINPFDAAQWPGTSSSGVGVAVAAGLCFAAVTTDTGGSVRLPAAANGLTGLKPTAGRVSRRGAFGVAESLDHVGLVCRSAQDAAAVLGAIAGHDPGDPTSAASAVPDYLSVLEPALDGIRIGVDASYNSTGVDAAVVSAMDDAVGVIAGLGAEVTAIAVPPTAEVCAAWRVVAAVEAALSHAEEFPADAGERGPLGRLIAHAGATTGADVVLATRERAGFLQALNQLFDQVDVLVVPTQGGAGFSYADHDRMLAADGNLDAYARFVLPFNMTGHPALVLPCGSTGEGVPLSFQLVSRPLAESLLFRVAHGYQSVTGWHRRHPLP